MKSLLCRSIILMLVIVTTGCSYIHRPKFVQGRDVAYLQAHSVPPMRVPPGIASSAFHNAYPVSDKYTDSAQKLVDITPPGLYS